MKKSVIKMRLFNTVIWVMAILLILSTTYAILYYSDTLSHWKIEIEQRDLCTPKKAEEAENNLHIYLQKKYPDLNYEVHSLSFSRNLGDYNSCIKDLKTGEYFSVEYLNSQEYTCDDYVERHYYCDINGKNKSGPTYPYH